jgi:heptaprenyl diphosphate synthase
VKPAGTVSLGTVSLGTVSIGTVSLGTVSIAAGDANAATTAASSNIAPVHHTAPRRPGRLDGGPRAISGRGASDLGVLRTRSGSLAGVPPAPELSPLLTLPSMDADRERIERAMHAAVQTPDPYLTQIASHLVVAGGKRLRPVIAVAAAQVGGRPADDDVVRGGVACELVHLGSLYHDDVIDESDQRRGVETVNAKWGNLQAILAGDFLLSKASEIAASLGTEVAGLLARTIGWLCQGEVEQVRHAYDTARPEDSYLSSIKNKTAALYGTAARVGGLVAGLDRDIVETLTAWGNAYGMVFQIVDDILDITNTSEQLGKPAGHDMVEGVYTLPVLRTLDLDHGVGAELRALLGKPLDVVERDKALAIVRANEGVESAAATARRYVAAADELCDALPSGVVTDAMRAATAALLDSAVIPA